MMPFALVLISLATGFAMYLAVIALAFAGFIVASPFLMMYWAYKDIKESREDNGDAILVTAPDAMASAVLVSGPVIPIETSFQPQIDELLEKLPHDKFSKTELTPIGEKWSFRFLVNAFKAKFAANGKGNTPEDAFKNAKEIILKQIQEWHVAREKNESYSPAATEPAEGHKLHVLIVDDDVDVAMGLDAMFRNLGCKTTIVTNPDDLHRTMSLNNTDLIVLDWMLSDHVVAGQVVERAVRVIDSFSDLRNRFIERQPKIITHSVLERDQMDLPLNGYFEHLDHWQKPISHHELQLRTSELIKGGLYG